VNDNGNNGKLTLTRREAIRAAGIAAMASGTLISVACTEKQKTETPKLGVAKQISVPMNCVPTSEENLCRAGDMTPSVFINAQPPGYDPGTAAGKYQSGDSQPVFPLVAFWLLLTTDNWEEYVGDPSWVKKLVAEFGRENKCLTCTDLTVLETTMNAIWNEAIHGDTRDHLGNVQFGPNHQALNIVRTIFVNHRNIVTAYGHPPCPGGGTILDIVGVVPKQRP
jgi:hypothetical protein